jgi:hypothetical protein
MSFFKQTGQHGLSAGLNLWCKRVTCSRKFQTRQKNVIGLGGAAANDALQ